MTAAGVIGTGIDSAVVRSRPPAHQGALPPASEPNFQHCAKVLSLEERLADVAWEYRCLGDCDEDILGETKNGR